MTGERDDMIAKVDLMENAVYRVKDGEIEKIDTPPTGFGKQLITWQDNKPLMWELSYTGK